MTFLDRLLGSRCGFCRKRTRGDLLADPKTGASASLCLPCRDAVQRELDLAAEELRQKELKAKEQAEQKRCEEERKAREEEDRRRKEPARQAWAAVLQKVRHGQPTQIAYSDNRESFANRVRFMELWAAEGTLPKVSLIVLDSASPRASKPFLVVRTGPLDDYLAFHAATDVSFLQRFLPGKTWADLTGASVTNHALPGNRLGSTADYDRLVAELAAGYYEVRQVIAIDGAPL